MPNKIYKVTVTDKDGVVLEMFDTTLDPENQDDFVYVLSEQHPSFPFHCDTLEADIARTMMRHEEED